MVFNMLNGSTARNNFDKPCENGFDRDRMLTRTAGRIRANA